MVFVPSRICRGSNTNNSKTIAGDIIMIILWNVTWSAASLAKIFMEQHLVKCGKCTVWKCSSDPRHGLKMKRWDESQNEQRCVYVWHFLHRISRLQVSASKALSAQVTSSSRMWQRANWAYLAWEDELRIMSEVIQTDEQNPTARRSEYKSENITLGSGCNTETELRLGHWCHVR